LNGVLSENTALLRVTELSCERDDRLLFRSFSWQAHANELWQLTGANGAGKTSLLNLLVGLLRPCSGSVSWYLPGDFREQVGYLGHRSGLRDELSARENLDWLSALHGAQASEPDSAPDPDKRIQVLTHLGLRGYDEVPLAQLSAGQKRRVALARLWLEDKRVWLLDEPFTAIDAQGVTQLDNRLLELVAGGALVIYTSHHRQQAHHVVTLAADCVQVQP
jgi:heme exporter protein A